jgi:hypothetical protein
MMRSSQARVLLLGVALALVAACPRSEPPPGSQPPPEGGTTCALPEPPDAGVPWRAECARQPPVDPCSQLELPDAGPVPADDRWCEDSARIRCAAWADAGTMNPTAEEECTRIESKRCAIRFSDMHYLTYWPAAAWKCLQAASGPDSPACGCVFLRSGTGAPCTADSTCRSGYCLKDANDAGTCVECPPPRPLGSPCGPDEHDTSCGPLGHCTQGCCVPLPTLGQACGGEWGSQRSTYYLECDPDTAYCTDTCYEACTGATSLVATCGT